jgi:hypothetical protein
LAALYDNGEGVEVDKSKAVEWYHKAALQNLDKAQRRLSSAYQNGEGVEKNLQLATYWMLKQYESTACFYESNIELLDYVPAALLKFTDLQSINSIQFVGFLSDEVVASIATFIRANSSIKSLDLHFYDDLSDDQADEFVKALELNTQLTELVFVRYDQPSEEIKTQITTLLAQNRYVGELRKYVEKHPLVYSAGFPLDIVNIMVDQMIVLYLKSGQSKEATQKAIDAFLMSVSVKALQDESTI